MRFHPATWLAAWCGFALLSQRLPPISLGLAACAILPLAVMFAGRGVWALFRRARWLLLTLALLFLFATPGERLPEPFGSLGLTHEGVGQAGEHVLRLGLLLATLAWLLHGLGRGGMLSGLYLLAGPLDRWHQLRARLVVRLMLTLDLVETPAPGSNWRAWLDGDVAGPDSLTLPTPPFYARDRWGLAVIGLSTLSLLVAP